MMRPIAKFVGAHSLMCCYMAEALPTPLADYRLAGMTMGERRPCGPGIYAGFTKLHHLAVDVFRRAGYFS